MAARLGHTPDFGSPDCLPPVARGRGYRRLGLEFRGTETPGGQIGRILLSVVWKSGQFITDAEGKVGSETKSIPERN